MDERVKRLIKWAADNAWRESRALEPDPQEHVPLVPLLDEIAEAFGVDKEAIGEIVNAPRA